MIGIIDGWLEIAVWWFQRFPFSLRDIAAIKFRPESFENSHSTSVEQIFHVLFQEYLIGLFYKGREINIAFTLFPILADMAAERRTHTAVEWNSWPNMKKIRRSFPKTASLFRGLKRKERTLNIFLNIWIWICIRFYIALSNYKMRSDRIFSILHKRRM